MINELQRQKLASVGITGRNADEFDPELTNVVVDLNQHGFRTGGGCCAGHSKHPCSTYRKNGVVVIKPNTIRTVAGFNKAVAILQKHGLKIIGNPVNMKKWGMIWFNPVGAANPHARKK